MTMIIHPDSHLDHGVSAATLAVLLQRFKDRTAFFVETFELPEGLPTLSSALYGPLAGDPPVEDGAEVFSQRRGDRVWESRLIRRAPRQTRTITVVAGPHDGHPCVLFTCYGGPSAPQEPGDLKREKDEIEQARMTYLSEYQYTEEKGPADLSPGYVDLTAKRDAIRLKLDESRRFWSEHALAAG